MHVIKKQMSDMRFTHIFNADFCLKTEAMLLYVWQTDHSTAHFNRRVN